MTQTFSARMHWAGLVILLFGWTVVTWGETIGAVTSHSAHKAGEAGEAEEHEHQPRHGGYFGDADDLFHYEVVPGRNGRLELYVNDEHNHPLDTRSLQGRWTLDLQTPKPVTGAFAPSADGAVFEATLPSGTPTPVTLEVAVMKNDNWVPMEFVLPPPDASQDSAGNH